MEAFDMLVNCFSLYSLEKNPSMFVFLFIHKNYVKKKVLGYSILDIYLPSNSLFNTLILVRLESTPSEVVYLNTIGSVQ